jgi:hypothetical protein
MKFNIVNTHNYDAAKNADEVVSRMVCVSPKQAVGTHAAHMTIYNGKAYIVYDCNDLLRGESANWAFQYLRLSVVDIKTNKVEKTVKFTESGKQFKNIKIGVGSPVDPKIVVCGENRLRVFFAQYYQRDMLTYDADTKVTGIVKCPEYEAYIYYLDYDTKAQAFDDTLHLAKLKTDNGLVDFKSSTYRAWATAKGFDMPGDDEYNAVLLTSCEKIEGRYYAVIIQEGRVGADAVALLNDSMDTFEIVAHFPKTDIRYTEVSVQKLPDKTWAAILRNEDPGHNYLFSTSADGKKWSEIKEIPEITTGTNSKPLFSEANGQYYLGWQELPENRNYVRKLTPLDWPDRQAGDRQDFNIEVSADGVNWERKYSFHAPGCSFQYPFIYPYEGKVYICATRRFKEYITFGLLE